LYFWRQFQNISNLVFPSPLGSFFQTAALTLYASFLSFPFLRFY